MKIAVTGATGQLGQLAIAALKTRAPEAEIIALARTPEKASALGVEVRPADYTDRSSLDAALQGVDVVVLISASEFNDRVGQHRNVIEAAKDAGVSRIIYTSILKADTSPLILAADHKATEPLITGSGMAYTILRNPWYTENWTGNLGPAIANGALVGCVGKSRVSPATRQDLAEAIAAVASEAGHENKTYELGCDDPFTMADLAAEASQQVGKPLPYVNLPKDEYIAILSSIGLPPGVPEMIADADAHAAEGWLLDESQTLSSLIGRPTLSLSAAVKAALPG